MKKAMGELELIERIRLASEDRQGSALRTAAPTARKMQRRTGGKTPGRGGVVLGIGDDCAILRPPPGHEVLVTTDFTLEGRHFRRDWHPPESVGHRALARGLSDLAAMGARPLGAFLSLALPKDMVATKSGRVWVDRFFAGLRALAEEHRVPLAGGDTSESPCGLLLADIVLVGSAAAGGALRRSGGRVGDALYVTGALGGAAAELASLERRAASGRSRAQRMPVRQSAADHPQLMPQPRVKVGLELVRRGLASAAIDLSDGLSSDLAHLCRESRVGAEIEAEALPIHWLARKLGPERGLELALNGGEDYELLFSADAKVRMPRSVAGVAITRIGRLVRGKGMWIEDGTGEPRRLEPGGWQHLTH
jgi:thiamine-monophosphate kinase